MVVIIISLPIFSFVVCEMSRGERKKNHTRYEKVREKEIDFTKEKKGEKTFDFPYPA